MFNNLPLDQYKNVLISSLKGLDIDAYADKTAYINKIMRATQKKNVWIFTTNINLLN